jgi:hypothetical protein
MHDSWCSSECKQKLAPMQLSSSIAALAKLVIARHILAAVLCRTHQHKL